MKLYTRRGDEGFTALFGGQRIRKDDPRVEAYGTIDELNASIGVALGSVTDPDTRTRLGRVQSDLFSLGAHLATSPPEGNRTAPRLPELPTGRIHEMESWIDQAEASTLPLKRFILPAGSPGTSRLHAARTVCRRAERRVVALAARSKVAPSVVRYLNRLSDYLFAAARLENQRSGWKDVEWLGPP